MSDLHLASQALAEGRPEAALPPLLEAWRACPTARLSAIIERTGAQVNRPPVPGKTAKARCASALELLQKPDPADLARLMAILREQPVAAAQQLVEAMEPLPRDPRFLPAVVALLNDPPWVSSSSHKFWRALLALQAQQKDPRAAPALESLDLKRIYVSDWAIEAMGSMVRRALKDAPRKEPPMPEALAHACNDWEAKLDRQQGAGVDLLGKILERPDDVGLRSVYADWLQERGDPRGEFIALQLARASGTSTEAQRRREAQLLAAHAEAWIGPLLPAVPTDRFRFERGFLTEVSVNPLRAAEVAAEPGWATVTHLWQYGRDLELPLALLRSPTMRSLRFVGDLGASHLPAFSAEPWSLTGIGFDLPSDRNGFGGPAMAALSELRGLPALEELALDGYWARPDQFRWLWATPTGKKVRRFRVSSGLRSAPTWLKEQEHLPPTLEVLELSFNHGWNAWTVALTRGSDRRFSRVDAVLRPSLRDFQTAKVADLVEHLLDEVAPDTLEHLHVATEGTRAAATEVETVARAAERQTRLKSLQLPGREPLADATAQPKRPAAPTVKEQRAREAQATATGARDRLGSALTALQDAQSATVLSAVDVTAAAPMLAAAALLKTTASTPVGPAWAEVCYALLALPLQTDSREVDACPVRAPARGPLGPRKAPARRDRTAPGRAAAAARRAVVRDPPPGPVGSLPTREARARGGPAPGARAFGALRLVREPEDPHATSRGPGVLRHRERGLRRRRRRAPRGF
ncbi:MAG: TIGR02996 domain-containing protein [Myxococcales bacterium]